MIPLVDAPPFVFGLNEAIMVVLSSGIIIAIILPKLLRQRRQQAQSRDQG